MASTVSTCALFKKEPPPPYFLPVQTLRTASTLHIPVAQLPNAAVSQQTPVSAMFFLEYCPELKIPTARMITKAEAAARLFVNALNPWLMSKTASPVPRSLLREFHLFTSSPQSLV